ncbi:MAG: hypothetical protein JRF72_19080 [Deltaproteobacteria bacterium]|jgi:hypothetical protein|nr:hypothetical protein [Deltaproteobacteria bacterium]
MMINYDACTSCGKEKPGDVHERYSFGVYAGRLCTGCCAGYRDNCGIGQPQGCPADLDEQYWEDDPSDLI